MESSNPYQTPHADVLKPDAGASDESRVFSPSGRFGRLSYIAWVWVVGSIGNAISAIVGGNAPAESELSGPVLAVTIIINLVAVVLFVIFSIRRCHDFNASGWWLLLSLIPFVNLFFFLYLWLAPGDPGANAYAPPRVTPGWERVLGLIGVGLAVVMIVGVIVALAIPAFIGHLGRV